MDSMVTGDECDHLDCSVQTKHVADTSSFHFHPRLRFKKVKRYYSSPAWAATGFLLCGGSSTQRHCQVGLPSGRSLGGDWRRRHGCPCARWIDQLRNDTGMTGAVPANLWRQTDRPFYGAMVE